MELSDEERILYLEKKLNKRIKRLEKKRIMGIHPVDKI